MSKPPSRVLSRTDEFLEAATARGEGNVARIACAVVALNGLLLRAKTQPLGDLYPSAVLCLSRILAGYSCALPNEKAPHLLSLLETAEKLFLDDCTDSPKKSQS